MAEINDRFKRILEMNNRSQLSDLSHKYLLECLQSVQCAPWNFSAVATGTFGYTGVDAKHPGVYEYKSSTSANSGRSLKLENTAIILSGGEKTTIIFKTATQLIDVTRRIGFFDTNDHQAPTDGVFFLQSGATLTGETEANATGSSTDTDYTLEADTWYRGVIILNSDATLATFTLYADDSETVLWTDTLATNIPKATGRNVSHGDICTFAGTTATTIGYLDYIDLVLPNARVV